MKIAIIGDLHLTNHLPYTITGDFSRKKALFIYLDFFFTKIQEKKVDFLVVPGDICHNSVLDSDDLDLLMHFLDLIAGSEIKTVIINGNHDLDGEKSILDFLDHSNRYPEIYYCSKTPWESLMSEAAVYTINYCSHQVFLKEAFGLSKLDVVGAKYKILIGHVGVKGTLHGTTKSILGVKKEDIEELSKSFDLISLGHHHNFQFITKNALYPGAPHQTRID